MTIDASCTIDTFREAILAALDETATKVFGVTNPSPGAIDADLADLFRAIDRQVGRLATRYNVTLKD